MSSIGDLLIALTAVLSLLDPRPVNINTAGEEDLAWLPGIDRSLARSIIEWRERFGSFLVEDDLLLVDGIGPATLEELQGLITLGETGGLPVDTLHWLPVGPLEDTLLVMCFLDVGNGDATLVRATGGETWLVDGGPPGDGPLVAASAARLLAMGVRDVDVVAFTHPHADHIGGLPDVLRTFGAALLLDPGMQFSSFLYEDLLAAALESGADYSLLRRGDVFRLSDEVSVEVVHTGPDLPADLDVNEASAVFLVRCGGFRAMIAGDIEEDTEMLLTDSIPPLSLALVPHHGSNTSAFPPFLRSLRPQLAVVSCGRGNPFGHPHADVLEAWSSMGAEMLRTDLQGTILVVTDGSTIRYSTSMRGGSP